MRQRSRNGRIQIQRARNGRVTRQREGCEESWSPMGVEKNITVSELKINDYIL